VQKCLIQSAGRSILCGQPVGILLTAWNLLSRIVHTCKSHASVGMLKTPDLSTDINNSIPTMALLLQFSNLKVKGTWPQVDPRVRLLLYAYQGKYGDALLTSLKRPGDPKRHGTGHAWDMVPDETWAGEFQEWLSRAAAFFSSNFSNLDIVTTPHGTGPHLHGEIRDLAFPVTLKSWHEQ